MNYFSFYCIHCKAVSRHRVRLVMRLLLKARFVTKHKQTQYNSLYSRYLSKI